MKRARVTSKKVAPKKAEPIPSIVSFNLENRTYQIDPGRQKVYRSFVEIETSKAADIYSRWRALARV
jgi:hypothetical protein